MKVSSLTKDETLDLLNLYKRLHQVEEELDTYISKTAAPEVISIKNARNKKDQSNEEATEILNSDSQTKDSLKMISLLEDYLESSEEIKESDKKSEQIMYVIDELLDKKREIEEEIKSIEHKESVEIRYDEIDEIKHNKCKLINCDKALNNNIIMNIKKHYNYLLLPNQNSITDELIKIVDEHINEKTKEEEEKLKIVNIGNYIDKKEDNISNTESIQMVNEQPIPQENIVLPENNPINEENRILVEEPLNVSATSTDQNVINFNQASENFRPISEIIQPDNVTNNTNAVNGRVWYVDSGTYNSKMAKIPLNKKETVFNNWNKANIIVAPIKSIQESNDNQVSQTPVSEPINFNINNFVNNKAA